MFDVLYTGDLYLLPGLKRYCGLEISKHMDPDNVTMIIRTARLFNLPRLENDCAAYIADNLDPVNDIFSVFKIICETIINLQLESSVKINKSLMVRKIFT